MIELLPEFMRRSSVLSELYHAIGAEVDEIRQKHIEFSLQSSPTTATWSLDRYEEEQGLPIGQELSDEQRRRRILSSGRYGSRNATLYHVQDIVNIFGIPDVTVVENYPYYLIELVFTGITGIPDSKDLLEDILRKFIPAHLDIIFTYNFFTFGELEEQLWDFDDMDSAVTDFEDLSKYA